MAENCKHNCEDCQENCADRDKSSFLEPVNQYSTVKKVIGIVSGKGGVGKSLITSLMASSASRAGYQTAVLDADVTGPSIPMMFGVHGKAKGTIQGIMPMVSASNIKLMSLNLLSENETDPVIWRGPVIAGLVKQFWTDVDWGDVDVMFIDMPPGTGDVPLTVFQSIPVDGIIVVSTPQELVGMIVEKALNMAKTMEVPVLGLVENMSYLECPDCGKKIYPFGESRIDAEAEKHGLKVLAKLPIKPEIASRCDVGMVESLIYKEIEDAFRYVEEAVGLKEEEEMTEELYDDDYEAEYVTLSFDDGDEVECEVYGVFECDGKEYIALIPDDDSDDVYIYGYKELEDDDYDLIDLDDEEFEKAAAKLEELIDDEDCDCGCCDDEE